MSDIEAKSFARVVLAGRSVLAPSDINALEWLEAIPSHKEILITGRRPRSVKNHRFFFAMLRKVIEATGDRWPREENLLDDLKLATGYYTVREDFDGVAYRKPDSISFASMDEDTFKQFVRRCFDVIVLKTGVDPELLMDAVDEDQGSKR